MHSVILENNDLAKCVDDNTVFYNGLNCEFLCMCDGSFIVRIEQGILRVIGCEDVVSGYGIKMYWNTIHGYDLLLPYIKMAIRRGWHEKATAFHCYSGTCFVENENDCFLFSDVYDKMSLPTPEAMRAFIRERDTLDEVRLFIDNNY